MSRLKRIGLIIFIILVALSAVATYFVIQINDNLDYLLQMNVTDINLEQVEDGTYVGEYEVFPVSVTVSVTVESHLITSIVAKDI